MEGIMRLDYKISKSQQQEYNKLSKELYEIRQLSFKEPNNVIYLLHIINLSNKLYLLNK